MLPKVYQHRYHALKQALEKLQEDLVAETSRQSGTLSHAVSQVQQYFQSEVMSLPPDGLDAADKARTRSYNTELHKQLRLLATDAMFLGSAQQPATVAQRTTQLRDRLLTLLRYCDVLLDEEN